MGSSLTSNNIEIENINSIAVGSENLAVGSSITNAINILKASVDEKVSSSALDSKASKTITQTDSTISSFTPSLWYGTSGDDRTIYSSTLTANPVNISSTDLVAAVQELAKRCHTHSNATKSTTFSVTDSCSCDCNGYCTCNSHCSDDNNCNND